MSSNLRSSFHVLFSSMIDFIKVIPCSKNTSPLPYRVLLMRIIAYMYLHREASISLDILLVLNQPLIDPVLDLVLQPNIEVPKQCSPS